MRFEKITAKNRDGSQEAGEVAVPESLDELLKLYDPARVFKLGLDEYLHKARRRLVSGRSPRITLRLADLSVEQQAALRKLGLLEPRAKKSSVHES